MSETNQSGSQAWSDDDVAQLRDLAERNTPTRVIGLKLNRSEDAIRSKAAADGIALAPPNQAPYGDVSSS